MMVWSINLLVLSVAILIVGMIKPKWLLFWMEQPGRIPILILSSVLFMVGATMFGEASRIKQKTQHISTQAADKAPTLPTASK